MAISTVAIANLALSKIGTDSTIESLTENSAEANLCDLWMDRARIQTLEAFNWDFARIRGTLATHNDDPPVTWTYRYIYPADCIKALFIENSAGKTEDPIEYIVEQSTDGTKSILCDEVDAILIYTKDETRPTFYPEWFIEMLAAVLGSKIAFALTGKLRMASLLRDEARQMAILAPAMAANEKQEGKPRDASHIRGRD